MPKNADKFIYFDYRPSHSHIYPKGLSDNRQPKGTNRLPVPFGCRPPIHGGRSAVHL